jgi:hypothetical protein
MAVEQFELRVELTVFRKTRQVEGAEVDRAVAAQHA